MTYNVFGGTLNLTQLNVLVHVIVQLVWHLQHMMRRCVRQRQSVDLQFTSEYFIFTCCCLLKI